MYGSTVEEEQRLVFDQLNRLRKSALRTASGLASLQVKGIREIGKCNGVKFCTGASMDLISISKLTAIGFKISFGDEEKAVDIHCRSTNEICCTGVEINQLYWITVESFL